MRVLKQYPATTLHGITTCKTSTWWSLLWKHMCTQSAHN